MRRALETLRKTSRGRVAGLVVRITNELASGERLWTAMERCGGAFPPLAVHLVRVGETSGSLDVVLAQLAAYYELQRKLFSRLISRLILPLLQYHAAVFVIALATYIGEMLSRHQPGEEGASINPFGIPVSPGMVLLIGWGLFPALYILYSVLTRLLGTARLFHEVALRIPIVGGLLRNFALGRFSWCLSLCTESGMGIYEAVDLSLRATGNAAFAARSRAVQEDLRGGMRLHESLSRTRLFPLEFIEILSVAEESGQVTGSMERISNQYFDAAERGAQMLASALAWIMWAAIAVFIIIMIFRALAAYMAALSGAIGGI